MTIIVIIGVLSFYGYQAFGRYRIEQQAEKRATVMMESSNLLVRLGTERIHSALYLGGGGKKVLSKLREIHGKVDSDFERLLNQLKIYEGAERYRRKVEQIRNELKHVRSMVDAMSPDYRKIFVDIYQKKVLVPLLKLNDIFQKDFRSYLSSVIQPSIALTTRLAALYENEELERSLLTYMIMTEKSMKDEDLIIWDRIIAQDELPSLEIIKNAKLRNRLAALLNPGFFGKSAEKERRQLIYGINSGKYGFSVKEWIKLANDYSRKEEDDKSGGTRCRWPGN